jgi:hypothetical protein
MQFLINLGGRAIRTDWIERIIPGQADGTATCAIWFCVGLVGAYRLKGKEAETALQLLAGHPALRLDQAPA